MVAGENVDVVKALIEAGADVDLETMKVIQR